MKKSLLIITLLSISIISSCNNHKDDIEAPKNYKSNIYDANGKFITELHNKSAIPAEYDAYINKAISEVKRDTGYDPYTNSIDIHTNLDTSVQKTLYENASHSNRDVQNTYIIKENKTGAVAAFYDEAILKEDNENSSLFDYHFHGTPIMMPIYTYALAFEHLATSTADYLLDNSMVYPGREDIIIKNIDDQYLGIIPIRQAFSEVRMTSIQLASSLYKNIGHETTSKYSSQFVSNRESTEINSLIYATVGFYAGAETISNAYQMMFNYGEYIETNFVNKIVFKDENRDLNLRHTTANPLSEQAAFLLTELLKDSIKNPEYFQLLNDVNRPYDLYGYSGSNIHLPAVSNEIAFMANVVGNVNYAITAVSHYDNAAQTDTVSEHVQTTVNALLDTIEQHHNIEKSFAKPEGIIKTNYMPGQINEEGIDAHRENISGNPNIGYAKEQ